MFFFKQLVFQKHVKKHVNSIVNVDNIVNNS